MRLQVMIVRTIMTVRKTTKHAPMMMKERSVSATREATGPLTWGLYKCLQDKTRLVLHKP